MGRINTSCTCKKKQKISLTKCMLHMADVDTNYKNIQNFRLVWFVGVYRHFVTVTDISRPCQHGKLIPLLPGPGFDPSFLGHTMTNNHQRVDKTTPQTAHTNLCKYVFVTILLHNQCNKRPGIKDVRDKAVGLMLMSQ